MNIKRRLIARALAAAAFWAGASFAPSLVKADPPAPDPIVDLTVSSGPSVGSVQLRWTATGDDAGAQPASRYVVKYRFRDKILSEADWDIAFRVDEPPVNLFVATPAASGLQESLLVTGLEPGVDYGFAVRSYDEDGLQSALSNSATAQATAPCGRNPNDGFGVASVATLPTSGGAGELVMTTTTITIDGNGIAEGGKITFRVPALMPPFIATGAEVPGGISYVHSPGGASLSLSVEGNKAVLTVDSGSIDAGDTITFHYWAMTCVAGSYKFFVQTRYESCGLLTDVAPSGSYAIVPGDPRFVDFERYDITAIVNQVTPIGLRVIDFCGNGVAVGASTTAVISAKVLSGSLVPDPSALLSTSPAFASPSVSVTATIPTSATGTVVYYRVPDTLNKGFNRVVLRQMDLVNGNFAGDREAFVRPVLTGITNSRVDTGVPVTGQKSVAITPDGDGSADIANISFNLPEWLPWIVDVSSNGFTTVARRFFGWGDNVTVAWDGYQDGRPGAPPPMSDNGTYAVRIAVQGSNLVDTSLQISLTSLGVQGFVLNHSSAGVSDVSVELFGPSNRYTKTDASGRYQISGLRPGAYQVRFRKTGYTYLEIPVNVASAAQTIPTAFLGKESVLRLEIYRPQSDHMEEIWGNVRANTMDWSKQVWGTVHFGRGKSRADAGDLFNTQPTSHTALTLAPNLQYRIHFEVPNLSTSDFNVTLVANDDVTQTVNLTARANIEGAISVPAGSNSRGLQVSVEAGPDANLDQIIDNQDPSKRYWGGAWLAAGETGGIYRIFGVANGTYAVVASAPGFIPRRTTVVVSNDQNATANFATFSEGGVISGTVTVSGDTTVLDAADGSDDGFFEVSINAWSPAIQSGFAAPVRVPENVTMASGTFTLTGLADGIYDIHAHLPGYELDPPGRRTANVQSGSGSVALAFQPYAGGLTGTITLPDGRNDYATVQIMVRSYNGNSGGVSASGWGSDTYSFTNLGTGFYQIRAVYPFTGYTLEKNVQIVNGLQTEADLDLSGETFTISGRVTTAARAPYNQIDYIVNDSTPTNLFDSTTQSATIKPAARIVAERLEGGNRGGGNEQFSPNQFESATTFFGTFDEEGEYEIVNLTPGVYRIRNNGELNNSYGDGPEVAETSIIVKVLTEDVTGQDLEIFDGYDVSGTIAADTGHIGQDMFVKLKNASGETVLEKTVFISEASTEFTLERIPSGDYVLSAGDEDHPKAFTAKDVRVSVTGAAVSGVQVELLNPAKILGQLRIKSSGILLTSKNYDKFISSDFQIEARANPWFNGGHHRANEPLIDADGNFIVTVNPGRFDLVFRTENTLSAQDISAGKKQLVPLQISGIEVLAGQSYDLGVVELTEGSSLSGTVRNAAGTPLPNIIVMAYPSGDQRDFEPLQTITNELGQYSLQGIDVEGSRFYDVIAAPRPQRRDNRLSGFTGTRYGEVRRTQVDTAATSTVDFVLAPASGIVTGRVTTPDGGGIELPFGDEPGVGAIVIMNKIGDIPQENPLGSIEDQTRPDGTFEIRGLAPGTYTLWALAKGYANGLVKNIVVGTGSTNVGDVELRAGFKLSGGLSRSDGTPPGSTDLDTLVAVRGGFEEVLVGEMTADAAGSLVGYEISGFQANSAYTILAFDGNDDISVLAEGISISEDTERDFTITDATPAVMAQVKKSPEGDVVVQFEFTRALRNSATDLDGLNGADDSEGPKIISLKSGSGTLTHPVDWLAFDRKRARVTYTPAAGESRFTLTVSAAFETTDPITGANHTILRDFSFFLGIGKQREQKFSNAGGGVIQLDEDTSEFSAQAGTFGTRADDTVNVVFRVAESASSLGAAASPALSGAMSVASRLGLKAYPSEMAGAINRVRTADVDPFSSFYDIFLPAGVNHFFPEGKEARLCLSYDESVADPYALNVYYFNTASNEFLLESENKTVDTDNLRICVSLSHASVFTVLASSAPVIAGDGYAGELSVMNFPNPFNLKGKTVTLQNPGSASASQPINGTMIKISAPGDVSGAVEIEIYSVSGERVKTLRGNIPTGGAHYYLEWDGTNDGGSRVASGVYVGRMTVGGGNEKFFKMAVIK